MPEKVEGLDDTERENNRLRAKLDREIEALSGKLEEVRDTYEYVRQHAAEQAEALANGIKPEAADGNKVAEGGKEPARVNLKMGDVVMNFDLAPHMAKMQAALQGRLDERINEVISAIKQGKSTTPNVTPATSAF
jgi:hypothetical protein